MSPSGGRWLQEHLAGIETGIFGELVEEVFEGGFSVALVLLTALTEPQEAFRTWRQVGEATTIVTEQQIDSLECLYALRRRDEVVDFLSQHPFLVALLHEAHGKIQTYFHSYRQLILEVVTDPEGADDRQLVLFIQTDVRPEEALDGLDRLDKGWWLKASRTSGGKLCIHVEYR